MRQRSHAAASQGERNTRPNGTAVFLRTERISRRRLLSGGATVLGASALGWGVPSTEAASPPGPFRFCLNTSTVRGFELGIVAQAELAAGAGYDAIEPWVRDIGVYAEAGGSLPELGRRFADLGLTVESAIGFAQWIVDDPEARAKGLEEMRRDMDALAAIGGTRIAAPPVGAHRGGAGLALDVVAERYRAVLELGEAAGVVPQLEVWGFSTNLSRLAESLYVVVAARHPQACLLPDFYHLYKGGSGFDGIKLLNGRAVQVFHLNDYPDMPREEIGDEHRVFPGDGVAPVVEVLRTLDGQGCRPVLSLELFNRGYWERFDAETLARTGLDKMRAVVAKAVA